MELEKRRVLIYNNNIMGIDVVIRKLGVRGRRLRSAPDDYQYLKKGKKEISEPENKTEKEC